MNKEKELQEAKEWKQQFSAYEWEKLQDEYPSIFSESFEEQVVRIHNSANMFSNNVTNNNGWTKLPAKELLPYGFYWVRTKHPTTEVEDVFIYEINSGAGIIPFAYATHYQPIIKPKPPIY